MAHIKTAGTTKGNRDSISKRLGVKIYAGQRVTPGNIIIRQRGSKFHAGLGVKMGKDFTLFALKEGIIKFKNRLNRKVVDVI